MQSCAVRTRSPSQGEEFGFEPRYRYQNSSSDKLKCFPPRQHCCCSASLLPERKSRLVREAAQCSALNSSYARNRRRRMPAPPRIEVPSSARLPGSGAAAGGVTLLSTMLSWMFQVVSTLLKKTMKKPIEPSAAWDSLKFTSVEVPCRFRP